MSSITSNRWRLTSNINQCTQSLSQNWQQWENSALIGFITKKEKEQKTKHQEKRGTPKETERGIKKRGREERHKMETFKSKIFIGQNWFRNSPPH
jgi:hypothetical protein